MPFLTPLASTGSTVGRWACRADSNADGGKSYLICITIGPVFFTAAIYLMLSRIIVHYGRQHARISPKAISLTFMTCDFIALLLQVRIFLFASNGELFKK